ncbi:MAG: glycosyltransferase family 2 protein [Thermoplasmataceae archaeon]
MFLLYVSVLIYTYDRKEYIVRAVSSVLQQNMDRTLFEITVVKGFLDDEIDDWLQRNGVKSVYLKEKSLGKKIARGVRESRGEIISFLDDDDEFVSSKLSIIAGIFDKDPEVDFVHNSLVKIGETGNIIDPEPNENPPEELPFLTNSNNCSLLSRIIRYRGDWYLSCISVRRSVLLNVLDSLDSTEQSLDKFIFFAALNHGRKMMLISDKLTRYRMHPSTTTYTGSEVDFIARRETFFMNTVRVFDAIVRMSANRPGNALAKCQLIQHKINLYLISEERGSKVSMREFVEFLGCLRIVRSRYQLVWIGAFLMRKISLRFSRFAYYRFFKMSFKEAVVN